MRVGLPDSWRGILNRICVLKKFLDYTLRIYNNIFILFLNHKLCGIEALYCSDRFEKP